MTAEIGILNASAVALAADSAVTAGPKIYNTANKLFALSKHQPVGVMVYGNANFMDIPWETIIKEYRKRLGRRWFSTVGDYFADFVKYLEDNATFFTSERQERFFENGVELFFTHVESEISNAIRKTIEIEGQIDEGDIQDICVTTVNDHYQDFLTDDHITGLDESFEKSLLEEHRSSIQKIKSKVFQKLPFSRSSSQKLNKLAAMIFSRKSTGLSKSGLVIAGFGEDEIFPALHSADFCGVLLSRVLHDRQKKIDGTMPQPTILPFAQSEMVHTFMQGVDPYVSDVTSKYVRLLFSQWSETIASEICKKSGDFDEAKLSASLQKAGSKICEELDVKLLELRREKYVNPVLRVVAILPKDELAEMAESLVNLTSFRRRMSMDAETVGGPIDVAVISKGDGFIWIKRKHYFDPSLNHGFLKNYFEHGCTKKENEDE